MTARGLALPTERQVGGKKAGAKRHRVAVNLLIAAAAATAPAVFLVAGPTAAAFADSAPVCGPVYDIPMVDDTVSYYLDCVNQFGAPDQLLLLTQANACPASAPQRWDSSFNVTFDSSF
jgi:hypothetical protein